MITVIKGKEEEVGVTLRIRDSETNTTSERYFEFNNYFYIKEEDFKECQHIIDPSMKDRILVEDKDGELFFQCVLKNNFHRNMIRNQIEELGIITYEADLTAVKRMLIDNTHLPLNQQGLRIAWVDIETDDRSPFVKNMKGDIVPLSAITSIAVKEYISDGDATVWYCRNKGVDGPEFDRYRDLRKALLEAKERGENTTAIKEELEPYDKDTPKKKGLVTDALWKGEKILLEEYFEYVKQFDVVSAYNGSKFDDPWIRERAKYHEMDYDRMMLVGFDYLESYKKNHYTPVKSFKLNDVGYEELSSELNKEGSKLTHPEEITKLDWRNITKCEKYFELFLLFPEVHREYNIQDVNLLDMLEKKLGFFKLHNVAAVKAHCLLIDTLYDSRICDIMILNESRNRKIIKVSKPNESEVNERDDKNAPGGFTYTYSPGLHWGVLCYDFASHYLNVMRTFNISSETYVGSVMPDLSKVFTPNEQLYVEFCMKEAPNFIDKQKKFQKKKYEDCIENKRLELGVDNMEKLMWKFIKNYDQKIEDKPNQCHTPADINRDVRGWNVHPHFIFKTDVRGITPTILDDLIVERDKVKYSLKAIKDSFEYDEKNYYQLGLKKLGNVFYGYSLYKASRDYRYEIGTAITSSARYLTKIAIIELKENGMEVLFGDTDSSYCKGDKDNDYLKQKFIELFNRMLPVFNTMEYYDKIKNENVIHTVKFEYEDMYPGMIPIKKKRYYYFKDGKINGKGGVQTRSDVLQLAKDLQKDLLNDIFNKKFDKAVWKDRLFALKKKIASFELEEEHIVRISGLGKPIEQYGKAMIDGTTGLQKVSRDGKPRCAPIPANVQIAKRLIEEGENIDVGTKIHYVIASTKPKIQPITLKEYRANKRYDVDYYYGAIIKAILEILIVVYPQDVYSYFSDCWLYTPKQLVRLQEEVAEEDEDEDDGDEE